MPPAIRTMTPADFLAFQAVRLEMLKNHPECFGSDYGDWANASQEKWRDRMKTSLAGVTSRIFLAEAGGEIVGTAGVNRDDGAKVDHSAFIWGVYVKPSHRNAKLAEGLIEACVNWCGAEKLRIVRLTVAATNPAATKCYLRCGFAICGVQPEVLRVDGRYYDELLMWRRV